ncbi:MAG: hypothetical protein M5U34_06625 [Chloroflexi bacterium]|nr:hypothetical protein [Chloroflexota bacterium]
MIIGGAAWFLAALVFNSIQEFPAQQKAPWTGFARWLHSSACCAVMQNCGG